MMSYLILFALIALVIYYGHGAYKIIKNFIDKKRSQKETASKNDIVVDTVSDEQEQTRGE